LTLRRLPIDPLDAASRKVFAGSGRAVRVEFTNDSNRDPVKVFPEPPLTIRQLNADTSCTIDGGVWVRDSVFLSEDEQMLVVLEFSGDLNQLIAYNTGTCKKLGQINVSGGRWAVNGSEILVGTHCATRDVHSCKKQRAIPVSKLCKSSSGDGDERQR
jgi:hypothetical protein